ncbi:hypothetical protein FKW85_05550 [Yersinia pestis]|nr:hypothetical protein [Yersinia pestis]TQD56968.1 hypothetical protein FKW85_05550 [Yersinia pestis]
MTYLVLNLSSHACEFFIGTGCALYEKSVLPQAPESKKIIFLFKCRLKQQYGVFTSTRQSIYPKSLVEQQAGSKQTRPDELTSVSDSGKCAQLTPLLFQVSREFPTSLEQQAGSKQTRPDELTSVSDSGKCAQLTPLLFQGRRELRLNKMLTIVSKLGD